MKLQKTKLTEGRITLLFSDAPSADESTEKIEIQVAVPYERKRPLAEAQLTALRRARDVIAAEMKAIQGLAGRNP